MTTDGNIIQTTEISFPLGKSGTEEIGIDCCQVLIFDNDTHKRLDSRLFFNMDEALDGKLEATSGTGEKIIVLLCNLPERIPEWEDVLNIKALGKVSVALENESFRRPVLSGCADFVAGETVRVELRPLTARIRLREICCDFRGTAYAFENIKDVRVYLTNVNADSGLIPRDTGFGTGTTGQRYLNNGGLCLPDCTGFREKGLIFRELGKDVGMDPVQAGLDFLCYANTNTEEAFGRPLTRLVIEGKIAGKTWYWPIDLCKMVNGGIKPGENYDIRLKLLRTGTDNPDTPVRLKDGEIKLEIEQWNEKEKYPVYF